MNIKNKNVFWIFIAAAIGLGGLGIIKLFFSASMTNSYQGWILIGLGVLSIFVSILLREKNKRSDYAYASRSAERGKERKRKQEIK